MALFAAAASASSLISSGKRIIKPISSLFGGSSCNDSQKKQKREISDAIRTYLSPGDMRNLVSGMESDVSANPDAMSEFFVGGRDCKHKNVSPGDQRFLNRLPDAIERAQQKQALTKSSSGKGMFSATVTDKISEVSKAGSGIGGLAIVVVVLLAILNRKAILGK